VIESAVAMEASSSSRIRQPTAAFAASFSPEGKFEALKAAGDWLRALSARRRCLAALLTGAFSALGFAPFDIFPALLLAYAVLMLLLDGAFSEARRFRVALLVGWSFGFGQYLAGLYWVSFAFTVDATAHAWQIPFVAVLLPGGLALFTALACASSIWLWPNGAARVFHFAAAYAIFEWLRGHVLTGFPWNLAAYTWGALPGVMQSASVIGAYGLTLLTLLLGASLAEFASHRSGAWRLPAGLLLLFLLLWVGGEARLALVQAAPVAGVRLRLVQPNVPQAEKYPVIYRTRNWLRLVDLSTAPAVKGPTIIVWPEAAPPFLLTAVPEALDQIRSLTPDDRVLMTGTVRVQARADGVVGYFNSFFIFSHGAQLIGVYDKSHLVPFGEYLPLPRLLHAIGLSKLIEMPDGFGEGAGPRTLDIPDAPKVDPLICYEIIFPGAVVGNERPGWIVNVTDDSWFGPSTGPYQHLLMARMRAIEEGLPVARDANTGISAIIDPLGRIQERLALGRVGFIDGDLPRALPPTIYARLRDNGFLLLVAFCLLCSFAIRQKTQSRAEVLS
jgi:apolipoprotein N-acyltransferase